MAFTPGNLILSVNAKTEKVMSAKPINVAAFFATFVFGSADPPTAENRAKQELPRRGSWPNKTPQKRAKPYGPNAVRERKHCDERQQP